jgi:hypothetical protein
MKKILDYYDVTLTTLRITYLFSFGSIISLGKLFGSARRAILKAVTAEAGMGHGEGACVFATAR